MSGGSGHEVSSLSEKAGMRARGPADATAGGAVWGVDLTAHIDSPFSPGMHIEGLGKWSDEAGWAKGGPSVLR